MEKNVGHFEFEKCPTIEKFAFLCLFILDTFSVQKKSDVSEILQKYVSFETDSVVFNYMEATLSSE